MIVRTYNRRRNPTSDDAVSNSPDYNFSSQDSDPFAFDDAELPNIPSLKSPDFDHRGGYSGNNTKKGSKVSRNGFDSDPFALDHDDDELSDLPSIKRPEFGGYSGNKIRKDSRVRNGVLNSGFDSESCDLNSTQESDELSILPEKKRVDFGDFGNKTKRASRVSSSGFNSDPFALHHVDELRADFGVKGGDFGKNTKRVSSSGFDSDPYALDYDELPKKGGDFGKKTKRGARNGVSSSGFNSDSYDLNSTQENDQVSILPEKKRGVLGNKTKRGATVSNGVSSSGFDSDELSTKRADFGGFGKKIRNGFSNSGFGSNPYDLNSSQENDELSILPSKKREDYGKKPQNGTKASDSAFDLDPYDVNSSLELDELSILPSKKSRGGADFGKKKEKVVRFSNSGFNSDPYDLNSSQENDGLPMPSLRNGKNLKKGAGVSSFDPYSLDSSQEPDKLPALPPRNHRVNGAIRKKPKKVDKVKHEVSDLGVSVGMATLMETQEGGEMMEHVDEVNFALDGLKKGQPARIRRASLLSLLSICGTSQQRRLLRTHGMAKTIIDAVLSLSFDDEASNLAAAALFYVFSSDKQDDHLLDSPSCIHFLIKLLNPATSDVTKNKSFTIGNKLLSLRKDDGVLQDSKVTDSTSTAITSKVEEILVSCKQMKSSDGKDKAMPRPELSPKWIALLTMEKASLSTIALEDTVSGNIRKGGSRFKERLRELGGLNAVFEVARTCHSVMERCDEQHLFSSPGSKDSKDIESLVVLLKCLKIMENATFLSNDNQCHLLEMKGSLDDQGSPRNFVKLILSITKLLSGLSLSSRSSSGQDGKKVHSLPNEADHASEIPLLRGPEADSDEVIFISSSSMECTSSQKNFSLSQNSRWLSNGSSNSGSLKSSYETSTTSAAETCLLIAKPSSSGSCSEIPISSSCANPSTSYGLKINLGLGKRCKITEDPKVEILGNADDPFAFDEDEFEPSKWDLIYGEPTVSQPKSKGVMCTDLENNCQPIMLSSQQESNNHENHHSDASDGSFSSTLDEEKSSLLADCLLAAIKVLMNLTNDNPKGCRQIGSSGGLETLSSIIASHFPSFSSSLPSFSELEDYSLSSKSSLEVENPGGSHLSDQDLDFLVAILGLLVNLVEKDEENRYRLAAASVALPSIEWLQEERHSGIIPLLCSIFLTNQGVGETAGGEGKALSWDDEEAVLQGEKEAEKMIVEAYSALLLAFLSTESKSTRSSIAKCLPDHKLAILVPVLERFVEFHLTLNMISGETHKAVLEVIESCRIT